MKTLNMASFGSVLTGREFGKENLKKLDLNSPVMLDFSGVNTLGSSYADEILIPIARKQKNLISIKNANSVVWGCIQDAARDGDFKVEMIEN